MTSVHATMRSSIPKLDVALPYLGFISGLVGTFAYLCTDMVSLRLVTIANCSLACCFYFLMEQPVWVSIFWGALYIVINAGQLMLVFMARSRTFTEEEMELYSYHSHAISVRAFGALLAAGATWHSAKAGDVILEEGAPADRIVLIASGQMEQLMTGHEVAELGPGDLTGEISLFTDETDHKYAGSVVAKDACRYVAMSYHALKKAEELDESVKESKTALLSAALAKKLIHSHDADDQSLYADLVKAVALGGHFTPAQTRFMQAQRKKHRISEKEHEAALLSIGLSPDELKLIKSKKVRKLPSSRVQELESKNV